MEDEEYEKRNIWSGAWGDDGPLRDMSRYAYKRHSLVTTGGVISAYECEETGALVMDIEAYERTGR